MKTWDEMTTDEQVEILRHEDEREDFKSFLDRDIPTTLVTLADPRRLPGLPEHLITDWLMGDQVLE